MSALKALKQVSILRGSVGADLQDLAKDRAIVTDPEETRRRRTIRLTRQHLRASWGFTLQTYGIRNKRSGEVEVMSYVDYVEMNGPAFRAGMKKGDVILSVNGESVDTYTHRDLVTKIQKGGRELRLVVLFEDCCRKVELQERYIRLKKLLNLKVKELRRLEGEESRLLRGGVQPSLYSQANGENLCSTPTLLTRLSALRQSVLSHSSTYSSASSDWDVYSEITSPTSLEDVHINKFAYDSSLSDVSYVSSSKGSNGSVSISLSSASDSQSEHKVEVSSDSRQETSKEFTGKGILKGHKLSSNGLEEESELDLSISTGQDDGDTDSQTSISLSESSPKMSSLSEIMSSEESNRHDGTPSVDDENFRQMYNVARWVGMNTGLERRRSLSQNSSLDIPLFSDVGGTGKARVLGAVNETSEEGVSNGQETSNLDSANDEKKPEVIGEEKTSNTATPTTKGSRLQAVHPNNFYIESDSEESSVMSGQTSRDRRDTVIDVTVRNFDTSRNFSQNSNTNRDTGDNITNVTANEYSVNGSTSSRISDMSGDNTNNVDPECKRETVPEADESSTSQHISHIHVDSELVCQNEDNIDGDQNSMRDSSQLDSTPRKPRFVCGVLVNDKTYVTKL
ncbi:general receptor for phosphoinositides 1-associated scaffold protein [Elysia marginata]|uniref:General receptor for phosphoinositides 1-associated scaffold protein n=1 Tax=Elysia marginata TaxID=1093978 RepID=A0AAV4H195_9GAST|nr:general receptor for phosphoinositides 1-associated scaffold protein [Elysia marginata]